MGAMMADAEHSKDAAPKRVIGRPFQKGVSGNPGGRPAASYDIATLARQYAPEALQALHDALNDPRLKVQAAQVLLDRGFGRPLQRQELSGPDGAPIQVQQVPDDRPVLDGFLVEFTEQKAVEGGSDKEQNDG
jgi:hypothetical protein